jgi:2-polyprenyl-6-methoxyphenol hydroxylase-like FAD-dependent oxidoreductase
MPSFHTSNTQKHDLPVIIAGAGPCGLIAALALQNYGVPFVIIEKAYRSKICSNAGSGFELATTSVEILNRLGIDVDKILSRYEGLSLVDGTTGKLIRSSSLNTRGGAVNRAQMQNHLLELLFPSSNDEKDVLLCGSGLETYEEDVDKVVATLSSGQRIKGCLLLACDGIHSRVRAVMHGGYDTTKDWETNAQTSNELDPLHYCDTLVYWGKTPVERGSKLEQEFRKTQGKDGNLTSFVFTLTTPKIPSSVFVIPAKNATVLNWAITVGSKEKNKSHNNNGQDLTRRGGGPLTEDEKKRLFDFGTAPNHDSVVRGLTNFALLKEFIQQTPAKDITEAGLYDRENLDLPFASETNLVVLLGDAAHPQTPVLGQGVNMAIADAYVYATNIALAKKANRAPREAIAKSNTADRHKGSKTTVKMARSMLTLFTSQNCFVCWLTYLMTKFLPSSYFANSIDDGDKSNSDFLKFLDENCCSPKEQELLKV